MGMSKLRNVPRGTFFVNKTKMSLKYLFSFKPNFILKTQEEKDHLIKIDSFNLLIRFLNGNISEELFHTTLQLLSKKGNKTKDELLAYISTKASYEAYQASLGKSIEMKKSIKKRLFKLIK